jgi:hypothetical protein
MGSLILATNHSIVIYVSCQPLPGRCCSRALSRDIAPFNLAYLLAHTSKWGVLEHSRILTPWAKWLMALSLRIAHGFTFMTLNLVPVGGRRSQRPGPSPTLGSLRPSHHRRHKSRVSLRGPPCAFGVSNIPFGEVRDRMGIMNSITLRSLGFQKFPRWNPSFGSCSPLNFRTYKLFLRLAHLWAQNGVLTCVLTFKNVKTWDWISYWLCRNIKIVELKCDLFYWLES